MPEEEHIVIECPHCKDSIIIYKKEFNCRIFRHGSYKKDGKQIDPHSPKEICNKLVENNQIYGCGKPFQLNGDNKPEICGYI